MVRIILANKIQESARAGYTIRFLFMLLKIFNATKENFVRTLWIYLILFCIISIMDKLLNSHQGRDALIKTFGYSCMLLGGLTEGGLKRRFNILSKEMSQCRIVLRMLDDWPMLKYSLQYGLGKPEEDMLLRVLNVTKNIADQVFYPVEHLAWFGDKRVLKLKSNRLWVGTKFLWAFSLYLGCIRSLRILQNLQNLEQKQRFETEQLKRQKAQCLLGFLANFFNLINAISWLPSGILWSGKLKPWHNGALGILASLLGLLQLVAFK